MTFSPEQLRRARFLAVATAWSDKPNPATRALFEADAGFDLSDAEWQEAKELMGVGVFENILDAIEAVTAAREKVRTTANGLFSYQQRTAFEAANDITTALRRLEGLASIHAEKLVEVA